VQANFLKGLSLLKVGHLSEAVTAFLNVLEFEKYYPLANMNIGICYVEMKQYAKAHQAFEAVIRDQSFIEPAVFDDVMQRTKYFWALAWTRLYKNATNPDKQVYFRQQALLKWKDYEVWFSKNEKYKNENLKAENYLKSLSSL
jgi:tetratricopeptide (TPR) repeat protein